MSDTPQPPPPPPTPMEELWKLLQLNPEWSISKQEFQPLDGDYQRDQLNFTDDVLNTAMDRAMQVATGQFDPSLLAPSYEENVIREGSDEGRRLLQATVERFPDSARGLVAEQLLQGIEPEIALENLGIAPTPKLKPDGKPLLDENQMPVLDDSEYTRMLGWADNAFDKYISDSEREVEQVEIDHPMVAWAKENNLPDPRQVYSADYVNPGLPAYEDANKAAFQQYQQSFGAPNLPQGPLPSETRGALPMQGLSGPQPEQSVAYMGDKFSVLPKGDASPIAKLGTPMSQMKRQGVGRNPATTQDRVQQLTPQQRGGRIQAIAKEGLNSGYARNDALQQTARAVAASNFLQSQGRTPIGDSIYDRIRASVGG